MSTAEIHSWRRHLEEAQVRCRQAVAASDHEGVRDALADLAALAVTAIPELLAELERLRSLPN